MKIQKKENEQVNRGRVTDDGSGRIDKEVSARTKAGGLGSRNRGSTSSGGTNAAAAAARGTGLRTETKEEGGDWFRRGR